MKMSISLSLSERVCVEHCFYSSTGKNVSISNKKWAFILMQFKIIDSELTKTDMFEILMSKNNMFESYSWKKKCQSDSSIRVEIVFVFIRCLKNPHSGKHSKKIILPLVQHFHSIWILTAQNLTHRRNYSWNIIIQDMKCIPKSFLTIILAWCFKFIPLLLVHIKSSNYFFILC